MGYIHTQTEKLTEVEPSYTIKHKDQQISSLRAAMHYGSSKHGQDSVTGCQQGGHPSNQTVTYFLKNEQTHELCDSISESASEFMDFARDPQLLWKLHDFNMMNLFLRTGLSMLTLAWRYMYKLVLYITPNCKVRQ